MEKNMKEKIVNETIRYEILKKDNVLLLIVIVTMYCVKAFPFFLI